MDVESHNEGCSCFCVACMHAALGHRVELVAPESGILVTGEKKQREK